MASLGNMDNTNNTTVMDFDSSDIEARLKAMEMDLSNKVDLAIYNNEIASIREMIGNMDVGGPSPLAL
jgi:hypothetical protein